MSEENKETKKLLSKNSIPTWIVGVVMLLVVLVVWGANFYYAAKYAKLDDKTYGQFGDFFGISNSLIAGFTLFLVAIGVWMQREELNETKKSLALQNKATERQMFENTFFKLLDLINTSLDKITIQDKDKKGIDALNHKCEYLYNLMKKDNYKKVDMDANTSTIGLTELVEKVKNDINKSSAFHIKTIIYTINFLVDTEKVEQNGLILINTLTGNQILLIAYYAIDETYFQNVSNFFKETNALSTLNMDNKISQPLNKIYPFLTS